MCMSAGHASSGFKAMTLLTTFHTLTPLAGFMMTFPWAQQMARGGHVQQQRVRCRALDRRDPSTIIPNHPQHTAHVARTPSASTHSRCSYLACAGCGLEDGGGWRSSTAQRPLQSSWGRGPSRGPCWRDGRAPFYAVLGGSMPLASRLSALGPGGGGLGTMRAHGPIQ